MKNSLVDSSTEISEYQPTPAEMKLLEVLSDPLHFRKSITEKCELADIDRGTYYNSMKKKEFVELIPATALQLVKSRAMDLVNASYDAAMKGSFADRELLLEMAELAPGKNGVTVNNAIFAWKKGE